MNTLNECNPFIKILTLTCTFNAFNAAGVLHSNRLIKTSIMKCVNMIVSSGSISFDSENKLNAFNGNWHRLQQ